ncbi:MAG: response regulator [Candidatus Omnitrophica bacterium]|nr:response regulator [Candidatus Omnitrophota bacterium]
MAGKVLLVDDEPDINLVLKARLEAEGYQVATAKNGLEALEKFAIERPDLIITDVMMPGLSGYEFFDRLRGMGGAAVSVPVIVISAKGGMEQFFDKWAIRRFMPKPLNVPELLEEVRAAIASWRLHKGGEEGIPKPAVLLAGISLDAMRPMAEYLTFRGFGVIRVSTEMDAVRAARRVRPAFILFEYWEDEAHFDAGALFKLLRSLSDTKRIPSAVFCIAALQVDASKDFLSKKILSFSDPEDLLRQLEALLQAPEFKRSLP